MSKEAAIACVAKGAALLDEKDPGWWRADTDRAWAEDHGFESGWLSDYPDLTAEWVRVITERRSA